eukprot:GHVL01002257.1.p1 GENE.GHVL01002257.1~~GHVL01002257.1.p1  ORF type:complete len:318 (-),score=39.62 GHVL01002257.1:126-1043(-)
MIFILFFSFFSIFLAEDCICNLEYDPVCSGDNYYENICEAKCNGETSWVACSPQVQDNGQVQNNTENIAAGRELLICESGCTVFASSDGCNQCQCIYNGGYAIPILCTDRSCPLAERAPAKCLMCKFEYELHDGFCYTKGTVPAANSAHDVMPTVTPPVDIPGFVEPEQNTEPTQSPLEYTESVCPIIRCTPSTKSGCWVQSSPEVNPNGCPKYPCGVEKCETQLSPDELQCDEGCSTFRSSDNCNTCVCFSTEDTFPFHPQGLLSVIPPPLACTRRFCLTRRKITPVCLECKSGYNLYEGRCSN